MQILEILPQRKFFSAFFQYFSIFSLFSLYFKILKIHVYPGFSLTAVPCLCQAFVAYAAALKTFPSLCIYSSSFFPRVLCIIYLRGTWPESFVLLSTKKGWLVFNYLYFNRSPKLITQQRDVKALG